MPRDQDAVRESGHWRVSYADNRRVPATAAAGISWRGVPLNRCGHILCRGRLWAKHDRGSGIPVGKERRVCRAILVSGVAQGGKRGGAVQLLGSSGTKGAGAVAGEPMKISVSSVIDESRISNFQISTYVLCFACLLMDGFDVQSLGYVAPAL